MDKLAHLCGVPVGAPVRNRGAYMISSALRWVLPDQPLLADHKPLSTRLPDALDTFMDTYLYFLPVPRSTRKPGEPTDVDLCSAVLCAMASLGRAPDADFAAAALADAETSTMTTASTATGCLHSMYPLALAMREVTMAPETQALLACLMALDPQATAKLSVATVRDTSFPTRALAAIQEETRDASVSDAVSALTATDTFLHKRRIDAFVDSLPAAPPESVSLFDAIWKYSYPDETWEHAREFCARVNEDSGLPTVELEKWCAISSLVHEDPIIGFHREGLRAYLQRPT